jgi:hypothetical protein
LPPLRRTTQRDKFLRNRLSTERSIESGWFEWADPQSVYDWSRGMAHMARKLRRRGEI